MRPLDFLYRVWSEVCEQGDYVFLSVKEPRWMDTPFKFDRELKGRVRDWLRQHPADELDLYFCPLPFSEPERLARYVKPVNLLWSDVDDGDPKLCPPTVLWESSPGRHHALWMLKERLHAEDAAELNRSVTYHMGADKGGWDLSQVLRIPGTYNHKYKSLPKVKLIYWKDQKQSHRKISKRVKHAPEQKAEVQGDASYILKRYHLPQKVIQLLNSEAEEGRRSDVIWYLENKLHDAGMHPDEIIEVIKTSDWNKYAGRRDEDRRLRTELEKIIEEKPSKQRKMNQGFEDPYDEPLYLESFGEVMGRIRTNPGWTVPHFWMKRSHGIVAGEPKSFKSTLVMDLGISIATGTPFLGKYDIDETGPVLYIQNENAHWIMKDRFEKMLVDKGLVGEVFKNRDGSLTVEWPPEIPFHMLNQQGFMLNDEDHRDYLEEIIAEIKPVLIILDPLYLMFTGDVSSAQDLQPILHWLLYLKNQYSTGVLVIHHYNKSGESKRGGQRMLGSTTLHGWVESAWYIQADADEQGEVVLEREFRGAGTHHKLDVKVEMGDIGEPVYSVEVEDHIPKSDKRNIDPDQMIREVQNVIESRNRVKEAVICRETGLSQRQVEQALEVLIKDGVCKRDNGRIVKA